MLVNYFELHQLVSSDWMLLATFSMSHWGVEVAPQMPTEAGVG